MRMLWTIVGVLGVAGCPGDDATGDSASTEAATTVTSTSTSAEDTHVAPSDGPLPVTDGGDDGTGACEMCGDDPCIFVAEGDEDCIEAGAYCVLPAAEACNTCMAGACPGDVGRCGDYSCIDYAVAIGGCGDAVPYASAYDCMADNCLDACNPGDGFTGCACI